MLKTRAITYVILVTLVVLGVLSLPPLPFFVISALVFLMASWEWSRLAGFISPVHRVGVVILILLLSYLILFALRWFGVDMLFKGGSLLVIVFWLLAVVAICTYPKNAAFLKSRGTGILVGCFVLSPWLIALNFLHFRPDVLLYALILIWMADTGAYFAGRWFGKHKLALQVSPGKTWEGVIGAFITTIAISLGGYLLLDLESIPVWMWILLNVKTVAFSIVGDLFESLFKRMRDLKDSGKLLPGHGGILDRIDSLTAALPIFTIGYLLLIR